MTIALPAGSRPDDNARRLHSSRLRGQLQDPTFDSVRPPSASPENRMDQECPEYLAPTAVRTGRVREQKPPDDLVLSLTSLYFRHIHHWLPFLDIRHVFADHGTYGEPALIAYALFGTTLQYSLDPRLTQRSRDAFWKYSKRTILVEALEEPSYQALEALTILVLDLSGMTNGPQVWGVLAVAVKMAHQLERSSTGHALRMSSSTEEVAQSFKPDVSSIRKLLWAIFALDSFVAITTRNSSEFSNHLVQQLIPFRNSLWRETTASAGDLRYGNRPSPASLDSNSSNLNTQTAEQTFSYQLELLDISRKLHELYISFLGLGSNTEMPPDTWFERVMEASSILNTWFVQLPPVLQMDVGEEISQKSQPRPSPLVATLNAYYYALRIYLHGMVDLIIAQQTGTANNLSQLFHHSRHDCILSVRCLSQIADSMLSGSPKADRLGWPFAWALWTGARYWLASRYQDRPLTSSYFDKILRSLATVSQYWQASSHYLRLLRISHNELESLAGIEACSGPSSLLLSVVDWRIPSCEVEDQGRVDPILRPSEVPSLDPSTEYRDLDMLLGTSDLGVASGIGEYAPNVEGMADWFCMPSMRYEGEGAHHGGVQPHGSIHIP